MKAFVPWMCVLALGAAGCGQPAGGVVAGASSPAIPSYAPTDAAEACPAGEGVHIPDDVGPVTEAYLCAQEVRPVEGDGEWQFSIVKGVTSGLDALLLAYRPPDATLGTGACSADLPDPRIVHLRGSPTLAVRAPLNGCHRPTTEAIAAFDALGTVEITATKVQQVTSQLSMTTGCPDRYKDMLVIEEESGGPRQLFPAPRPVPPGTGLCSYVVAPDQDGDGVGQLSSARPLTQAEVDQINAELTAVAVDPTCARHGHTRFAALADSASTLVPLDGCAIQQDSGWWRATDRLRALVA